MDEVVASLVRGVLDEPLGDAPRLVLADALAERGDPRGELILLQIAIANGEGSEEKEARVATLIDLCWDDLAGFVLDAGIPRFCVRRGFVEALEMDGRRLDELPEMMKRAPVMELTLTGSREAALALAKMRELLRIRVLKLPGMLLGNTKCMQVLRSPFLANIETLDLSGNGLGEPAIEGLMRSAPHLTCLEHLYVGGNRLDHQLVTRLRESPLAEQLLTLGVDADADEDGEGVWFPN